MVKMFMLNLIIVPLNPLVPAREDYGFCYNVWPFLAKEK